MTAHKDLVAIPDFTCESDEAALKQLAVMFDRIGFSLLKSLKPPMDESPDFTKTKAWLLAIGILFELDTDKPLGGIKRDDPKLREILMADAEVFLNPFGTTAAEMLASRNDPEKVAEIKKRAAQMTPESLFGAVDPQMLAEGMQRIFSDVVRLQTIGVRSAENLDAYAVIVRDHSSFDQEDDRLPKHDVLQIALALPVPDEHVPWQKIVEFRHDPESQKQFRMLKNCMSDIAAGSLTPAQVEEKLVSLISSYYRQMERHKLHPQTKRLEAYLVTTAETAAQFERFRWTPDTQLPFAIEHRQVGLLAGEPATPGTTVAYLIDARSLFSGP